MPDQHGNRFAREGVDFCVCGSKYWEDDRCMDCGNRMTVIRLTTRELLFAVDYLGDHDQEFVNEDAEWPVSGRDIATKIREQLPSPRQMDPNQALYDLLVACVELDRDAAREAVEALAVWISRGGALPEVERNFVADSFHVPPTTAPLN